MKIHTLEHSITSGTMTYPVFIGFVRAGDLLKVAEVPNFQDSTPNHEIASNVLTPPVKQWQRPLMEQKRDQIISTFNGMGEFMPNPVLVAERCVGPAPEIKVETLKAAGSIPTEVREITIPEPHPGQPRPLWIIDGQHRITGLGDAACAQNDNPLPVVLLLNMGEHFYDGRTLAKIFAQVTTEATPLKELHKEWLTFAFDLDSYSTSLENRQAMEATATLCKSPINTVTQKPNVFHDDIKFNDGLAAQPKFLGHLYDCKDLTNLMSKYYYQQSSNHGHLAPTKLAGQISTAFAALKMSVNAPHSNSVFFAKKGSVCHKIMCDAFLVGTLAYLRKQRSDPTEKDWASLLQSLNFHITDWNFQQHVNSSARWVEKSKSLALDVFSTVFGQAALPDNVSDIWDFLRGDQLFVKIDFKHLNANGNPVKKDSERLRFSRGDKKTVPMSKRKYFRVAERSVNAKHVEIYDEKSSPADPIVFKTSGEYLRPPKVKENDPSQDVLTLTFKCTLYGGAEERITLNLTDWK